MELSITPTTTFEFDALRGVGKVELSFLKNQRVYALFGSNGVGKTKCLEALFQLELFSNDGFISGEHTPIISSSIFVAQRYARQGLFQLERPAHTQSFFKQIILQGLLDKHHSPVVYVGAGQRSYIGGEQIEGARIGTFSDRQTRYFSTLVGTMESNFSSLGMNTSLQQWFVTLAYSANPYQKKADSRKIEIDVLLRLLHEVDHRVDPEFLQISGDNRVSLKVDAQVTDLQHLSSGFASLLKILQAIISGYAHFTNEVQLANVRGTVFIDEIESHLHVEWQSKIVLLLKRLFPNTTFYIATHAPMVLTQLEEGEAYRLCRDRDGVVRSHLINAPNKQALIDVLYDGFGVDVNALKRERMSSESQEAAKKRLLNLINGDGAAT